MADEHLLEGNAISLSGDQSGRGYDPILSTVVLSNKGQLVGTILIRQLAQKTISVEARAIGSAWRSGSNLANHLLLRSSIHASMNLGFERVVFTVDVSNQTKQNDTQNMARRTDGRCHKVFVRLQSPC